MDPIDAALQAIESLEPGEHFTYTEIAKRFSVVRSTLTRRHQRASQARQVADKNRRNLHPNQERELIQYIHQLTERGLPPTRHMMRNFASNIAHKEVSMSWVSRFVQRYKEDLISRWSTGLDTNRHNADTKGKYELYFQLLYDRINKYGIQPEQTYNMDEKGFLLGITGRTKRIFSRALFESKQVQQSIQDGSREWISVLACICADGSLVAPALIYQSDNESLQSSWVEEIDENHGIFITSTTSGWSNNQVGVGWLEQVFDRCTTQKARRQYRLLILDGHGSHVTMDFINYCDQNKILLAVFPPHATHTLQPLDVCIFKSLSTAYTNELAAYLLRCQGLSTVAKRDFFPLFWKAWASCTTPQLIVKAFTGTGIWPQDPTHILERFNNQPPPRHSSRESSLSVLSASDWRKIERLLRSTVSDIADRAARTLSSTIHSISVQNQLLKDENKGLREALANQKRRKTKGKALPLLQPEEWHGGAVFWSPARVQRARDALAQQEADKQEELLQKARKKEIQRSNKELKQRLQAERRIARAQAQEARARERAEKDSQKALRKQARIAKKRLKNRIKLSQIGNQRTFLSTPRKTHKNKPPRTPQRVVEVERATPTPSQLSSRSGRTIKTPTRYL